MNNKVGENIPVMVTSSIQPTARTENQHKLHCCLLRAHLLSRKCTIVCMCVCKQTNPITDKTNFINISVDAHTFLLSTRSVFHLVKCGIDSWGGNEEDRAL